MYYIERSSSRNSTDSGALVLVGEPKKMAKVLKTPAHHRRDVLLRFLRPVVKRDPRDKRKKKRRQRRRLRFFRRWIHGFVKIIYAAFRTRTLKCRRLRLRHSGSILREPYIPYWYLYDRLVPVFLRCVFITELTIGSCFDSTWECDGNQVVNRLRCKTCVTWRKKFFIANFENIVRRRFEFVTN